VGQFKPSILGVLTPDLFDSVGTQVPLTAIGV